LRLTIYQQEEYGMKEMLRSLFATRGIPLPEEDLENLAVNWDVINQLKASAQHVPLADFNIALVHIPKGGVTNEQ